MVATHPENIRAQLLCVLNQIDALADNLRRFAEPSLNSIIIWPVLSCSNPIRHNADFKSVVIDNEANDSFVSCGDRSNSSGSFVAEGTDVRQVAQFLDGLLDFSKLVHCLRGLQ